MKRLAILLLAGVGLAGCVAVAEPPHARVYVGPPAVTYYGYYGPRYRHHHHHHYGHRYP
jgi:hypothetical protein